MIYCIQGGDSMEILMIILTVLYVIEIINHEKDKKKLKAYEKFKNRFGEE